MNSLIETNFYNPKVKNSLETKFNFIDPTNN